jgi:hypothetical protein
MTLLVDEALEYFRNAGVSPDHCEIVDYVAEAFQTDTGEELGSGDFAMLEYCILQRMATK